MKKSDCCNMAGTSMCKGVALITLIIGILYLLQDLGKISFWRVSWYTIGFIALGLMFLFHPKK